MKRGAREAAQRTLPSKDPGKQGGRGWLRMQRTARVWGAIGCRRTRAGYLLGSAKDVAAVMDEQVHGHGDLRRQGEWVGGWVVVGGEKEGHRSRHTRER